MDEFGVLVESIGFKSQGKSAPMADLKSKTDVNGGVSRNFAGFHAKSSAVNRPKSVHKSSSANGSFHSGDLDGIFQSGSNRQQKNYDGFDDVFGGPPKPSSGDGFDLDSFFKGSNNYGSQSSSIYNDDNDDLFGVMPGLKSSGLAGSDDVFGSMASPSSQSVPVDDLLGDFGGMGLGSNGSRRKSQDVKKNAQEFDDLIPGFGGTSPSRNGYVLILIHFNDPALVL
ncbi:auxilin-related protein 2-like [Diospyros lotus]|uniref:auxilin-related protein 2-like n=1 Tax=Diospyros lotus TaxID=55363 RepID=UPI002258AD66|nr:auxilin-related protein 2-like [Diospyros lotus]